MTRFNVFFCDEVRQEITGKHFMIGVYSGDLIPAASPGSFPLSAIVRVQGLTGKHHFHMRLLSPNGVVSMDIEDDVDLPDEADGFPITFGNAIIQVDGPGYIIMEMSIDQGDPAVIATLKIHSPETPVD